MNDVRLAFRALRASPIVSTVAALSLALGIGANTTIFSLVNSLMLRSMPVRDPERLALVANPSEPSIAAYVWSFPVWDEIRQRPELFDRSCAFLSTRFNLASSGETDFAVGLWASGSFFETVGVSPILGRTFSEEDDEPGRSPVAVISYDFWQRRFGGVADVLSRTLTVEHVPFSIVGVLPKGFSGAVTGRAADVVVPFGADPLVRGAAETLLRDKNRGWVTIMARLKPGQTLSAATAALRAAQPQIREAALPTRMPADRVAEFLKAPLTMVPAQTGNQFSPLRVRYGRPLLMILAIVGIVLIIACGNIANLLLARAVARRHELSVRSALGASRWRLARQLLIESVTLAAIGASSGLVFAWWGSRLVVRLLSSSGTPYPVVLDLTPDLAVLGFTAAVTSAAALLFGTAPALAATRVAPIEAIKAQGRTATSGHLGLANGLVVGQVALSLVLVVGAGLFVRTFATLASTPLGLDPSGMTVAMLDAPPLRFPPAIRATVYEHVRQAVARVPGVTGVALSTMEVLSGGIQSWWVDVSDGVPLVDAQSETFVNQVSPGWFSVYKTRMLKGRDFADADGPRTRRVGIVNRAFVEKFLKGADPVGRIVRDRERPVGFEPIEIVGMVADAVYNTLRESSPPTLYVPLVQFQSPRGLPPFIYVSIRADAAPLAATRNIVAAVAGVKPDLALSFQPLPDVVRNSLAQERLLAILSGFFGALALFLAALGLFGVTSYSVARRRGEIGIRMALGAAPNNVIRMVLRRVTLLVFSGIAAGAVLSWWMARFVTPALLFGVQPRDPLTTLASAIVLIAVAAFAGWLPARRASRIDPMTALRAE
jgi:putative ABC transport system permease protein